VSIAIGQVTLLIVVVVKTKEVVLDLYLEGDPI
jgi:hypothetical protein